MLDFSECVIVIVIVIVIDDERPAWSDRLVPNPVGTPSEIVNARVSDLRHVPKSARLGADGNCWITRGISVCPIDVCVLHCCLQTLAPRRRDGSIVVHSRVQFMCTFSFMYSLPCWLCFSTRRHDVSLHHSLSCSVSVAQL